MDSLSAIYVVDNQTYEVDEEFCKKILSVHVNIETISVSNVFLTSEVVIDIDGISSLYGLVPPCSADEDIEHIIIKTL